MNIVKNCDLIGPELKILINGNQRFKSKIGGIFTLIWLILIILAFCAFGRDIIEKKNPLIQMNSKVNLDRIFNYDSNKFTIMFAITDNVKLLPINNIQRKMKLYFNVRNTNATKSVNSSETTLLDINYDLIPCNSSFVLPGAIDNLIVDVSNYWCVPPNIKYQLINGLGEGTSQWFRIQMEICKNSTKNDNNCLPSDQIYNEFSTINVHYVISDIVIDGYDYLNPGKENFISGLIKGGSNTWSRNIYWFNGVQYTTDKSWILESNRNQNYFKNNLIEAQLYSQPNTQVFFSHLISIVQLADYYNRSYIKIQGVFAYIGGFISFFKLFFGFIDEIIVEKNLILLFESLIFRKLRIEEKKDVITEKTINFNPNNIIDRRNSNDKRDFNFKNINFLNTENVKIINVNDQFVNNVKTKNQRPPNNKFYLKDSHINNKPPIDKLGISEINESLKNMNNNLKESSSQNLNKLNSDNNFPGLNEFPNKSFSEKYIKKDLDMNLWNYIFPFLIKKATAEEQTFNYLKSMNQLRKKYFSFEKIIKTIKDLKILKHLILESRQKFLFKFSNISATKKNKEIQKLKNKEKYDEKDFFKIFREFSNSLNKEDLSNYVINTNNKKGNESNNVKNCYQETINIKLRDCI